jgi:MoxR-like ATPase
MDKRGDETGTMKDITDIPDLYERIQSKLQEYLVGHHELVELILIAMLSEGHLLIEGIPGTAKTTVVKSIARLAGCQFSRVQCAVDTQPADIIGIRIYNTEKKDFELKRGPIFSNIILIDEINRITPKTQAAFIEAMSERQVTIDGITSRLVEPFFVIATQNPYESEGTFPLIEAQKDRFMLSHAVSHLDSDAELEIVRREHQGKLSWNTFSETLTPLFRGDDLLRFSRAIREIHMEDPVIRYIRDLVVATRTHGDVRMGVSSRASIALVRASKVAASLERRGYVIPDDVKKVLPPVFQHRLILTREAEIAGTTTRQIIGEILSSVEVP